MKVGVYSFEDGKEPKDLEKQIKVLKKQLKIAVRALKDSRYLFYQSSQIIAGDGIAKCLKEMKELDK